MQMFLRLMLFPFLFFGLCAYGQDIPEVDWNEFQKTKPWEATQYYEPCYVTNTITTQNTVRFYSY